ncbi:hypothetical protein [Brevibacillus porteri]|uniref:Phage protein n=1 Tax=Brevibacillus porteri TaxID=2126350 RepID=A0ABX5FTR1_9BACL|nr:hypothetical protein [Brevibacillus porteri]MED1801326.1 hypothetical protein [Brevibacillus porteri]MED2135033.1 hypothetical protein [Brevibacillus porteri]MED2745130.1 hypothetical protein [Brevibacillus porteri]MED2813424.1 hypothetical protein [Brevibacillus porteri]MED2897963.1 hypothetical protein [Brevibacillus porteri]
MERVNQAINEIKEIKMYLESLEERTSDSHTTTESILHAFADFYEVGIGNLIGNVEKVEELLQEFVKASEENEKDPA